MAAKLPSMKRTTKKSKAKVNTAEDEMPMPQAVTKPLRQRTATSGEKRMINQAEKNRAQAIGYLQRRDGMDEETAGLVVDSMDPADIVQLNIEAADAVIAKSKDHLTETQARGQAFGTGASDAPSAPATSPAATPATSAVPDDDDAALPPVDFLSVEGLVSNEEFPQLAIECRDAAVTKNKSEKEYKEKKKMLDLMLISAGIDKLQPVMCLGVRLVRYTGKTVRQLSDVKLLEKGVSIDIINQCWVQGEYNDVRVTTPKVEE